MISSHDLTRGISSCTLLARDSCYYILISHRGLFLHVQSLRCSLFGRRHFLFCIYSVMEWNKSEYCIYSSLAHEPPIQINILCKNNLLFCLNGIGSPFSSPSVQFYQIHSGCYSCWDWGLHFCLRSSFSIHSPSGPYLFSANFLLYHKTLVYTYCYLYGNFLKSYSLFFLNLLSLEKPKLALLGPPNKIV